MTSDSQSRPAASIEWWMRPVSALVLLQVALAAALWARPGHLGLYLWYLGPPALALLAVALLAGALASALRRGATWNRRRAASCLGLALVAGAVPFYRTYPSSYDARPSAVRFGLPLDGLVTVVWGGATAQANYHVVLPDQRWAYDLLVTANGASFQGAGRTLTDYFSYDRAVRAPAAGLVVAAADGEPDVLVGRRLRTPSLGNHVVLQVGPGEFLFVAHLRRGSVAVAAGERIVAGQVIGRVGNSGTSSEPHVHLHLQDTPRPFFGEGIPFFFWGYRQGDRFVARGMPRGGVVRKRFAGDILEPVLAEKRPGPPP